MSTVVIKEEPVGPGGPDGSPPPNLADNSSPSRPEHIPEKFWDAEKGEVRYDDLAKSYAELEKKLGQRQAQPEQKPADPQPEAEKQAQEVSNILEANGLDPQRFTVEIQQNGSLSEESYAELEAKGFPRAMVDQYLAGAGLMQEAAEVLSQAQLAEVYGVVGGEDSFKSIATWAAQNVDAKSLETYNQMVNSGNVAQAKAALTWIKSMYTEANGSEPNLLNGDTGDGEAVEPFRSTAQLTAAMRDPRYRTDPAYRAEVVKRLAKSSIM